MSVLWTRILRLRWTPLMAAVLTFFALGLAWQARQQVNRQNRTNAQLDLVMISDSLKSLSTDGAVALSRAAVRNLDARSLYGLLSATNAGAFLLEHQKDWDQRRELVDPWGRPFQIQLIYPCAGEAGAAMANVVEIKIWSVGPNGRDEAGAGDDIAAQTVALRLMR